MPLSGVLGITSGGRMRKITQFIAVGVLTLSSLAGSMLHAQSEDLTARRTPVGTSVEVSPGQEFYAETKLEKVPAYRLSEPFKSSMGGAMGLPFGFAIDETVLVRTRVSTQGWEYFVPENGQFRAFHGLLGSVIAEGDTVGLRVHETGKMEWFVDNSIKNGMTTIWSRKVKKKDPELTRFLTESTELKDARVERLIYLGFADQGMVRIRHEIVMPGNTVRDEFTFPVDANGLGVGAVKDAEFTIEAGPVKAIITVTNPMQTSIGDPL